MDRDAIAEYTRRAVRLEREISISNGRLSHHDPTYQPQGKIMKRRSFLAMLGLAPVAAVAKQLPNGGIATIKPDAPLSRIGTLSVDAKYHDAIAKAMKEQNKNFAVVIYDKLRSRDGKLEMTNDTIKIYHT